MPILTDSQIAQQQAQRKQALAQALQQQAFQPIESADSGALKAPISWTQGLAKMLQGYAGGKISQQADSQLQESANLQNKRLADTLQGAFSPIPGQEQYGPSQDGLPMPAGPSRQRTPQEIAQALMGNPDTMNLGGQMMIKDVEGRNAADNARQLAQFKHDLSMDPNYIKAQQSIRSVDKPYYTPVQTAQGVYSFNARTGKMELVDAGGAPVVGSQSDPNLQAKIAYGKKAGTETGDVDVQQHETAISALENITKIDQLVKHLKESDAITGMGSDFFKNIERAKVMVANSEKAGKKVSDTELLDTMMGSEVFPLIKSLGIGARGMDTPAEREFMRSVLTGQTNLNKQTLLRMAEIRKDIANRAIKRWNDRVGTGELDRYFEVTGRPKGTLGMSNPETKTIGGKTYFKQNGQWFEK